MERELGKTLLVRHKGGAERGHTELTAFARGFMHDFAELREKVRKAGEGAFRGFHQRYKGKKAE